MENFLHCNMCSVFFDKSTPRKFFLAHCMHTFCQRCVEPVRQEGYCTICQKPCGIVALNKQLSPQTKKLFLNPMQLAANHHREVSQIYRFQQMHQNSLMAHMRGQLKKMAAERRTMWESNKKIPQYEQEIQALKRKITVLQQKLRTQNNRESTTGFMGGCNNRSNMNAVEPGPPYRYGTPIRNFPQPGLMQQPDSQLMPQGSRLLSTITSAYPFINSFPPSQQDSQEYGNGNPRFGTDRQFSTRFGVGRVSIPAVPKAGRNKRSAGEAGLNSDVVPDSQYTQQTDMQTDYQNENNDLYPGFEQAQNTSMHRQPRRRPSENDYVPASQNEDYLLEDQPSQQSGSQMNEGDDAAAYDASGAVEDAAADLSQE